MTVHVAFFNCFTFRCQTDNLLVLRCIYFDCDSLSLNIFSSHFPTHGWEFRTAPHTLGCVKSEGMMTFFLLRRRSWKHLNVTSRRSPSGWGCVYVSLNLTPEAKSHLNCNKNITRHDISIIRIAQAGLSLQMLHLKTENTICILIFEQIPLNSASASFRNL